MRKKVDSQIMFAAYYRLVAKIAEKAPKMVNQLKKNLQSNLKIMHLWL
jgi:hypothetical protein